ncbi:AAA family ATPase [Agrobacterium tumefaciens]|uniref:ATP-dependent nuclease n=1 Tax=Agrobacterium tumefaciens TaxID=358 RepID=UPI0034585712
MKIALLEIENFRGIRSGKVAFGDHSVLIGPNNSGKTTVIEALALVLGRDRLVRSLTEHDFFGSDPAANDRIKIVATVIGFGTEHPADHPDWFRDGRGVPFWFDPMTEAVVAERVNESQTLACQIIFSARFDRDSLEVETARHFADADDIDVFGEENFIAVSPKLIRELGLFIMPAARTWDRMLSFGSELFRRVVRSADGMPSDTVLEERDRLRDPENKLDEDPRFKPIVDAVNDEMRRLMGDGVSALRLRLTSTDSAGVLEAIAPHFSNAAQLPIPSKRQGNGLISLQSLFLLLHFAQKRIEEGGSFMMALEEPELHLPPSVQRRILARLQALSTQTIVTTHSPLISAYCEPTSLLVVRNDAGSFSAKPLLKAPLAANASNGVRKLFQLNRTETVAAMMSDRVLVPEGRFDFEWLDLLVRVVELGDGGEINCSFGSDIGVIPTHDSTVEVTCACLSRAHPHVIALVDGDPAGQGYSAALVRDRTCEAILRWPDGWTVEDVIALTIKADEAAVLAILNADLPAAPGDLPTLITRLKAKRSGAEPNGLKDDRIAHESIANAMSRQATCRIRAAQILQGIADVACGNPTARFVHQNQGQAVPVMVFVPW